MITALLHDQPYRVMRPFLAQSDEVVSLLRIFRVPKRQILPSCVLNLVMWSSTQSWDVWYNSKFVNDFNTKQNTHLDSFRSLSGLSGLSGLNGLSLTKEMPGIRQHVRLAAVRRMFIPHMPTLAPVSGTAQGQCKAWPWQLGFDVFFSESS